MNAALAIVTQTLTKRYHDVTALDQLTIEIPRGEVFGLLGPNGAGKTTTLRLLLAFARPTSGSAFIVGFDAQRERARAHEHLAFVSGDLALWPQLTGRETLDMLGRLHGGFDTEYRAELIERFNLDPDRRVRAYSKGNRQKVGLIGAFMTRADVLILDEPTSGLDPLMDMAFRQCVHDAKANGQTVLVSSHVLSEVEATCDRVGILRAGRLVDVGTLDDLRGLAARSVEATFAGPPPSLDDVPGLTAIAVDGQTLRCHVNGPMAPLLRVLADAGALEVTSREPSLEELFLAHYGDDA
ncbi:MAG TPA: ABC transporter ATP-binding protein [Acidimicrobiia bacterium]|nr:ABC transporter ATP-binding protein [Acidimicrobiia bacterium]